MGCHPQQFLGFPAVGPHLLEGGGAKPLTQFFAVGVSYQGVVEKPYGVCAGEQHLSEQKLPSRGFQEICAADHRIDPLFVVVYHHTELIGPAAVSVPDQDIAALDGWGLDNLAIDTVVKRNLRRRKPNAEAVARLQGQIPVPAETVVVHFGFAIWSALIIFLGTSLADLLPTTVTSVDVTGSNQSFQVLLVNVCPLALVRNGAARWCKPKPSEVIQNTIYEMWPAAGAVVIFHAQKDMPN